MFQCAEHDAVFVLPLRARSPTPRRPGRDRRLRVRHLDVLAHVRRVGRQGGPGRPDLDRLAPGDPRRDRRPGRDPSVRAVGRAPRAARSGLVRPLEVHRERALRCRDGAVRHRQRASLAPHPRRGRCGAHRARGVDTAHRPDDTRVLDVPDRLHVRHRRGIGGAPCTGRPMAGAPAPRTVAHRAQDDPARRGASGAGPRGPRRLLQLARRRQSTQRGRAQPCHDRARRGDAPPGRRRARRTGRHDRGPTVRPTRRERPGRRRCPRHDRARPGGRRPVEGDDLGGAAGRAGRSDGVPGGAGGPDERAAPRTSGTGRPRGPPRPGRRGLPAGPERRCGRHRARVRPRDAWDGRARGDARGEPPSRARV